MHVSSRLPSCSVDPGCVDLLFHTDMENGPWVEFDLGAPEPDPRRRDPQPPRLLPGARRAADREISMDKVHWKEVAHQDKEFSRWKAKFPRTIARHVRLRVPKMTFFGFASVAIR